MLSFSDVYSLLFGMEPRNERFHTHVDHANVIDHYYPLSTADHSTYSNLPCHSYHENTSLLFIFVCRDHVYPVGDLHEKLVTFGLFA